MFKFSRDRRYVGTFVKTTSPHIVEILGLASLDFLVLDGEHAPFGRESADMMLMASRAAGIPTLVRVPDHQGASISGMLDMGAAGVVVPHVDSAAEAKAVIAEARFTGGRRGYSPSPRFGCYGTRSRQEVIEAGDASLVVCQIESAAGVDAIEDIARVPGLSALFIGRADLSMSLGVDSVRHPAVLSAVERISVAATTAGVPVVVAIDTVADMAEFAAMPIHGFVIGTDQSLLRRAASGLRFELDKQPALPCAAQ